MYAGSVDLAHVTKAGCGCLGVLSLIALACRVGRTNDTTTGFDSAAGVSLSGAAVSSHGTQGSLGLNPECRDEMSLAGMAEILVYALLAAASGMGVRVSSSIEQYVKDHPWRYPQNAHALI